MASPQCHPVRISLILDFGVTGLERQRNGEKTVILTSPPKRKIKFPVSGLYFQARYLLKVQDNLCKCIKSGATRN